MTTNEHAKSPSKSSERTRIRAARAARGPASIAAAGEALADALVPVLLETKPGSVACYLSTPTEPSTHRVLSLLWQAGVEVITPQIRGQSLTWVRTEPDTPIVHGHFGIREAAGGDQRELSAGDVILLPALAVDVRGFRLGQGGGFYDRALASLAPAPLCIALLFADEDQVSIEIEDHDMPVDAVATESGIRWIRQAGWSGPT